MYECYVYGLTGTVIRTDPPMSVCGDCALRCWLQIPNCQGFVSSAIGDGNGECTYYSSITGVVEEGAASLRAVVKESSLPALLPPPCEAHTCPNRNDWPKSTELCSIKSFSGTVIRSDVGVRMCNDCAERCWFQMSDCVGFETDAEGDEPGTCTYYSSITGAVGLGTGSNRGLIQVGALPGPGDITDPNDDPDYLLFMLGGLVAVSVVAAGLAVWRPCQTRLQLAGPVSSGFTTQRDVEDVQVQMS